MGSVIDTLRLFSSLSDDDLQAIEGMKQSLDAQEQKKIVKLLKQKKISLKPFTISILNWNSSLLKADFDEKEIISFVEKTNKKLVKAITGNAFKEFSSTAFEKISSLIAPNLVGMSQLKKAAALQLFTREQFHILLLGDPGVGKTEILSSAAELYPISSFGLGSGTSSAGLSLVMKGKELIKGLLPMADGGICCIDELNLMKKEDSASLYNAMEKGFVSYDKGGNHYKVDSRISVLATANPKGDKFEGHTPEMLRKQLPFDSALLSRFHLVFLTRKPDIDGFKEITRKIISYKNKEVNKGDIEFVKNYIRHAENINVNIPSTLEQQIVDFAGDIKKNEHSYLIEVSPRLVVGLLRLVKAAARIELRDSVEYRDLELVKSLVNDSLKTE